MRLLHPLTRPLRRLYDWMLGLADKPGAEKALAGLSFAESSFFPIPPDPLLLAMGAGAPRKALRFAFITTVASVLGALLGYAIGAFLMDTVGQWLLDIYDPDGHIWDRVKAWYDENGGFGLLLAAITPIPFKVFTIASGALDLPLATFVLASVVGRGLRFGVEGAILRIWGKPVVAWMDKWFDLLAILFSALLIGGFVALKYL